MNDEFFLNLAIREAWKYQFLTLPNPAVGACVVDKNGKILAVGAHKKCGQNHAEVEAIKQAVLNSSLAQDLRQKLSLIKNLDELHFFFVKESKGLFEGGSIFVSLEPCDHYGKTPSCSKLIKDLGIKRVVFAQQDKKNGGSKFLRSCGIECKHNPTEEARSLLEPFLLYQKKNFVLFKFAQRLNGSYDKGQISCEKSQILVHKIRSICDLIVIGGNTARIDKPILDARLVSTKAPNVLIVSKTKNIPKNIPFFNVPERKVFIEDNFDKLQDYKFVLIEGGQNFYEIAKPYIDKFLIFQSPSAKCGRSFNSLELEYDFVEKSGEDLKIIASNKKHSKILNG